MRLQLQLHGNPGQRQRVQNRSGRGRLTRGFSLLEIVLATAIFSIATLGLAQCLTSVLEASSKNTRYTAIRLALQNHLAVARVIRLEPGKQQLESDLPDVKFDREIRPMTLTNAKGEQLRGLVCVRITAAWQGNSGPMSDFAEVYLPATQANPGKK